MAKICSQGSLPLVGPGMSVEGIVGVRREGGREDEGEEGVWREVEGEERVWREGGREGSRVRRGEGGGWEAAI